MGAGTNPQRSKKSALLHPHIGSTDYVPRSIIEYSGKQGSPLSSPHRPSAVRRALERQAERVDDGYGFHKVSVPLFYEVSISRPLPAIANRLRQFGRTFPLEGEVVQVAHILKKRGRYYLCHFKALLYLDEVITREAVSQRDLAETLAAVDMLVKTRMVSPLYGKDWPVDSFGPVPHHVLDTAGDPEKHWRFVSKYTFKKLNKEIHV